MTRFLAFLATIRWQDLVDITINSYILFRMYVLFRGTNALRILLGIAVLWSLQRIAGSLGLIVTSWALQGITAAAAIIIVVVFRNEIRTALQVRNFRAFIWGMPNRELPAPVEIIVDTVYQMGRKRIGALLVLPGREDLQELIHGGIPWDGTLSREMITSIFWPKGPVHDGAIIVQGQKITEVGVLLPLSQRQDLPTFYGTRHRAAAGLAERSDALVIVVSEERGRVSVAKGHWMRPVAQPEDLLQILREHLHMFEWLEQRKQKRERWKIGLAAFLSLLSIIAVWLGFTRGRDTTLSMTVPVEYYNRPSNLEILETSVNDVKLQLSGSSALIRSLNPAQVEVRVDLSKAMEGVNTIPVSTKNIVLPPGISVSRTDPAVVKITLDLPIEKELAVQVDWVGRFAGEYKLVELKLSPDVVKVIGGKDTLAKINTIYTVPVRLDSLHKLGSFTTSLVLNPPSLKLAPGTPDRTTVFYRLQEKPSEDDKNP
ncbi:MAG TPA: DisA protein [Syntrophobacteraceae bacterium]|jgi:diadenylate cyclase|nr:DisA protein [Syntrophobacteraceae bacterium]